MKALKPMTHEVRNKIALRIKSQLDISDLIKDYNIKGLDLTGAIINFLDREDQDISNTLFIRAIIGTEDSITTLSGCNLNGCNFMNARFNGKVFLRYCDLRNANFSGAWLPTVDYRYSDLRNINLCEAVLKVGSRNGYKAKFEWSQFDKLAKYLELDMDKE